MPDIELTQEDQWSVRLLVLEFIVGEMFDRSSVRAGFVDDSCEKLETVLHEEKSEWSASYVAEFVDLFREGLIHWVREP
jgi:hypothetical protein